MYYVKGHPSKKSHLILYVRLLFHVLSSSPVDKTQDMSTVILPKLKPTGAKPWEKG
jgi:hypothetical protein